MHIRPIRTDDDYRAALLRAEALMDAEAGTPESDELDVLATLIEAHESAICPLDLPDPIEAVKFSMEQNNMTPKDLQPMIGRLNRVYEVLNRTRPLTLPMIRKLHAELGIPAESLIKAPSRAQADGASSCRPPERLHPEAVHPEIAPKERRAHGFGKREVLSFP